jgi:hypothetical protein
MRKGRSRAASPSPPRSLPRLRMRLMPAVLLPAALLTAAPAAEAFNLQSLEEAQQKLYPGKKLTPADFKLAPEQYSRLKADFHVPALRPAIKAWRVEGGGWLYLDQVYGRDDILTYLAAVSEDGRLLGIEVLVCAEGYCDHYTPQWRGQLTGRTAGNWDPSEAATLVSGATLSCTHVAEGVKKLLAIHARYRPGMGGG